MAKLRHVIKTDRTDGLPEHLTVTFCGKLINPANQPEADYHDPLYCAYCGKFMLDPHNPPRIGKRKPQREVTGRYEG